MRVTMVVSGTLTDERAETVAEACVGLHAPAAEKYWWEVRESLPVGIAVDVADQLQAHLRDAGPSGRYMVVWIDD